MLNDPQPRNTLGPLVLRLALGVIFLYHGVEKIVGENNDLGASWATILYLKQDVLPGDLADKLAAFKAAGESDEAIQRLTTKLIVAYNQEKGKLPEALYQNAVQFAVAWGEAGCGLLLLLGALTRIAALAMILVQVGAIYMVTYARGFSSFGGAFASGYEYNVALIAMCLALAVWGAGSLSVDAWWCAARKKKQQQSQAQALQPPQPAAV
jgi:uncharacterized membrane protein YphA (DoxX/SURF4 family)